MEGLPPRASEMKETENISFGRGYHESPHRLKGRRSDAACVAKGSNSSGQSYLVRRASDRNYPDSRVAVDIDQPRRDDPAGNIEDFLRLGLGDVFP